MEDEDEVIDDTLDIEEEDLDDEDVEEDEDEEEEDSEDDESDEDEEDEEDESDEDEDSEDDDEDDEDSSEDDDEDEEGDDTKKNKSKSLVKKYKQAYLNQKRRAEKAEGKLKGKNGDDKKSSKKSSNSKAQGLTFNDQYALMRNNVHEDDVSEIADYAKLKKIPISQALKSPVVRGILKDRENKRKSSKAISKGGKDGRRGSYKTPISVLLKNAKKGIMPDNDADLDRLVDAEMAIAKKRKK